MRRNATHAEKVAWGKAFGRRLKYFEPCIDSANNIIHWSAAESHWSKKTVYIRICDFIGSWEPAPDRIVDCMTCLTRINDLFVEE